MARKKSISFSSRPGARASTNSTETSLGRGSVAEMANQDILASAVRVTHVPAADDTQGRRESSPSYGLLGKALYGTAYGVSFGVVFSVLVVGMLVPGRRIIGKAMTDATESAKRTFYGMGDSPGSREQASGAAPVLDDVAVAGRTTTLAA